MDSAATPEALLTERLASLVMQRARAPLAGLPAKEEEKLRAMVNDAVADILRATALLTATEVALRLDVEVDVINDWCRRKHFTGPINLRRKGWRIPLVEFERFLQRGGFNHEEAPEEAPSYNTDSFASWRTSAGERGVSSKRVA